MITRRINKTKTEKQRALSLISGGIDSPVASFTILSEGFELLFVHFDNGIYGDKRNIQKVKQLIKKLSSLFHTRFKFYIVPFEEFHKQTLNYHKLRYHCVLCKRAMLKISERIAVKEKINFIVTGDNLGQVASQTLSNIKIVDSAVKLPVIRPLLFFDKQDIINLADKIGTYNISIIRTSDCKAVPTNPATKSDLREIVKEERELGVDKIINNLLEKVEVVYI